MKSHERPYQVFAKQAYNHALPMCYSSQVQPTSYLNANIAEVLRILANSASPNLDA